MQDCIWGVVYFDDVAVKGATVTLHHPGGNRSSTTAIVPNNEIDPIFRVPLDGLNVQDSSWLSLTVSYSGTQSSRMVRYVRSDPSAEYNEQQVDFHLQDPQTPPPPDPEDVQVVILWVLIASPEPGQTLVGFHAQAETSDGSAIVEYEWKSDRIDTILGTASSVQIPISQLPTGRHQITVKAVNDVGVESAAVSRELVIDEQRLYLPVIHR